MADPTFPPLEAFQIHEHDVVFDPAGDNLNFADAISSFKLTPQQSVSTWKGGRRSAVFSDVSAAVWQATIAMAQDWNTATSLVNYLIEHEGEQVPVDYAPIAGGTKIRAVLILAAPEIGGDVDAWAGSSITCGVVGKPTFPVPGP